MSIESTIVGDVAGTALKSGLSFAGGWQIKAILIAVAVIGIGTPGVLFYLHVTHIEDDNKSLTLDRNQWKDRAVYWYNQDQTAVQRLKDAQATMGLLAQKRTTAVETQRKVTNAFKQTPTSTADDASAAVNDAFGVLSCASSGSCNAGAKPAAHRPARP